ncbi:MAG: ABC transporter permease, partial [Bryobacteraceae bacterium]
MHWRGRQRERNLQRELDAHLELEAEEQGDAYAARRALGNTTLIRENVRAVWGWILLEQIFQDIRRSVRTLRRALVFTVVALLLLALGIGGNAAIFELLDAVRLRSLPVPKPQELARVEIQGGNRGMGIVDDTATLTYPLWEEIRKHQQAFSSVLAWSSEGETFRIGEGGQVRHVPGLLVSGSFFSTLGVPPAAGRLFNPDDDRRGCASPPIVLSYGLWQTEFAGRSSAIGRRLTVEAHPFEIIGVA